MTKLTLTPVSDDDFPVEVREKLIGNVLNVHRMMAHSPRLMEASADFRNFIVKTSGLGDRNREILILRTAYLLKSEYEWAHHVKRGMDAGISEREIAQIKHRHPSLDGWSDGGRTLIRLVDEVLGEDAIVSEDVSDQLIKTIGEDGLMEAIFTIGFYRTLGTVLKSYDVPLDEGILPASL